VDRSVDNRVALPPDPIGTVAEGQAGRGDPAADARGDFAAALQQELARDHGFKFSAHASQRLQSRAIQLGAGEVARIGEAVQRADQKGAKESLILVDDLAFLVSVKNRTVITAVDSTGAKGNVFTNIDSVVIA
jgi:flagellar operon protein